MINTSPCINIAIKHRRILTVLGESTEQAEVTLQHHLDILQYIESQAMPVVEEVITKHPEDHDVQEEGRRFLAFFSPEFRVQQRCAKLFLLNI